MIEFNSQESWMSNLKVFESAVQAALKITNDDQAINYACAQLECMYEYTNSKTEIRSMCTIAVENFYMNQRFRGNDHVLRIFQILVRISRSMGASGIYGQIEQDGYFKNSLKFHILWAEAEAAKNDMKKFKDVWSLARQRCAIKGAVDASFKDIADRCFPNEGPWWDDEEDEKTLAIFAPAKSRRRSVALLEMAARPVSEVAKNTKSKSHFMSCVNPLRECFIDRDDGYMGISMEEYRVAKSEDLADMDITMMKPIEEENEMDIDENEIESKKMRIHSPARPLLQKNKMSEMSPLVAHTSFTSNFYNKAMSAFSDTMNVHDVVEKKNEKEDIDDETFTVEQTPPTSSTSKESFSIFVDDDNVPPKTEVAPPPPPPPIRPRGLSSRFPTDLDLEKELFDGNEPTMAGFNRECKQHKFLTSTPAVKGFDMYTNPEEEFWNEERNNEGPNLSVIGNSDDESNEHPPSTLPIDNATNNTNGGASAFARKRKSFGGGVLGISQSSISQVGDKARSSIGPRHIQSSKNPIENALSAMSIGGSSPIVVDEESNGKGRSTVDDEPSLPLNMDKINPWDREIRELIMSQCSTPVNRHDLPGCIKQPKAGQKMELGGETFILSNMIGEGGFAKVFLCTNEKNEELAMKYETPSCEWEVYILEALRKRLRDAKAMNQLMLVTDAFIYSNCSLILSEYLPMGTLLQLANNMTDPHWSIVLFLALQMVKVLKTVHSANIVHGDAKPDNWMIIDKIDENASINELLDSQCVRLIDWGRAIDMRALGERPLYGKAGTEQFDCVEMQNGKAWTYHPDYFALCGTIYVLLTKEYMNVMLDPKNNTYRIVKQLKRRAGCSMLWQELFSDCLNIKDINSIPSWDSIYDKLKSYFIENMDTSSWKEAVRRFNKSLPV